MCVCVGGGTRSPTPVLKVLTSNDYESAKKNQLPSVEVCLDHPLADNYKDKRLVNCLVHHWLVFYKP